MFLNETNKTKYIFLYTFIIIHKNKNKKFINSIILWDGAYATRTKTPLFWSA